MTELLVVVDRRIMGEIRRDRRGPARASSTRTRIARSG